MPCRRVAPIFSKKPGADRVRDGENIVFEIGAIKPQTPGEGPGQRGELEIAAQSHLVAVRDNLFEIGRVGRQRRGQQARLRRVRAFDLARRRCAVGLGIAGISRNTGREFVGRADRRVEAAIARASSELRASAINQRDLGKVVAACDIRP
jgi:hypothetical protein